MHEVQEEYLLHPAYLCVRIQEVRQETLETILEEEMDMMSRRRTRLFTRMMQHAPLASLMVILTPMVLMIDIHGCISR